jgi:hypothetical protein
MKEVTVTRQATSDVIPREIPGELTEGQVAIT